MYIKCFGVKNADIWEELWTHELKSIMRLLSLYILHVTLPTMKPKWMLIKHNYYVLSRNKWHQTRLKLLLACIQLWDFISEFRQLFQNEPTQFLIPCKTTWMSDDNQKWQIIRFQNQLLRLENYFIFLKTLC